MRPNINLPDGLHGEIKYYLKQRDNLETLDDAYEELLETGLDNAPYPATTPNQDLPTNLDRIVSTAKHGVGLNQSLMVAETMFPTSPVVSTTSRQSQIYDPELSDILAALADLSQDGNFPRVVATISQVDGEWYALGTGEIYHALRNTEPRWNDKDTWETHKREQVTICANVSNDIKLLLGGQASPSTRPDEGVSIRDPWLTILTDGYPVTGDNVAQYAAALNFPTPKTAEKVTLTDEFVTDPVSDGPLLIDPEQITDEITYTHRPMGSYHSVDDDDESTPDPWVSALVVDNPFYRDQLESLATRTDLSDESVDKLLARDSLVIHLLDHHPLGDAEITGYRLERIQIHSLSPATGGKTGDITNVSLQARYLEQSH